MTRVHLMLMRKELHKCDSEKHTPDAEQWGLKVRAVA